MNSEWNHPLIGICILFFVISMVVLPLCVSLSDGNLWLILCLFPSLILTALVGCIAALWMRLRRLETQVRFLQDQLYKLEKDSATTSKM
ncbi:hypothetical protein [Intestinimonas butyriciproducens]|uniref:hypothetical protein n=1 Tax=Intestinimonas butyriciproducens TaxID=1297617 RepID=UPI00195E8B01|nr:hypothetical protein [Intestinimonas butyriciproducens]MBM6975266.1 hypothetical protein [Intestinimonas butyriciproducens]